MIDVSESWESIFDRAGLKPPRRGRGQCPFCDSRTGFSCNEDKGLFFCFACNAKGDKISFIQQYYKTDFPGALQWFGIEPGRPPGPDPETVRKRKIREGLKTWARNIQRQLRNEFFAREKAITKASERLKRDPEDTKAWEWLAWALPGQAEREYYLDLLSGKEEQQLEIFKSWRKA